MAKINGIELKAVKNFEGMEGYGFSANIYMDGKKVGTIMDRADGGCYYYSFTSKENEKQIMERVKSYFTVHPQLDTLKIYGMAKEDIDSAFLNGDLELLPILKYEDMIEPKYTFFNILLTLKEKEQEYKRYAKDEYRILVHVERVYTSLPKIFDSIWHCNEDGVQHIIDVENEKYPYNIFHIYRSLEDFCIN